MRSRWYSVVTLVGIGLLALAGCGTHGYAAPLAKPVTIALSAPGESQSLGIATFTPIHATRFVAYYKGHQIPNTGAANPAIIREGSCTGPAVAPLTDGTSEILNAQGASSSAATQPDPSGGEDIAVNPGSNWYVVVFDHPNDAAAPIVACGNALSDRQQYFDLYEAARGSAGIALGTALMSPIVATRLDITLDKQATSVYQLAVSQSNCQGAAIWTGTIERGASSKSSVIFRPLDAQSWWLSMSSTNGRPDCVKVGGK